MVWAPESHFDRHLPFSLLTGFLGSGKTSFLNWLLRNPRLGDTAVAVNEFGAIPLDHDFIESETDDVIVLANGCMCCFATDDLEVSLARIFQRSEQEARLPFKRLLIETSGLADPEFVLQAILDTPIGSRFLWLDRIVTTVDALHGLGQIARHPEALKQVRLADRLLITKSDLADEGDLLRLRDSLASINPATPQLLRQDPGLGIDEIFSPFFLDDDTKRSLLGKWVEGASRPEARAPPVYRHTHTDSHATRAEATTLTADVPVNWREFCLWLGREQRNFGDKLLRVKGIVNAADSAEPIVVHGVQSTLHVPVSLKQWPDVDRRTRIVFILTINHETELHRSWNAFLAATSP